MTEAPRNARSAAGAGATLSPLRAHVAGIGCLAPGLSGWAQAAAVLRGEQEHAPAATVLPVPELLPPAERRRASRVIKLALGAGLEAVRHAGADASTLATVFAASGADGHNCHALCEQLAGMDRQISPTRFHNSVHNAAAGYWGIATRSMAACQVIGAYDASFGAGLLDALAQVVTDGQPVLLVAYDSEYPEPLHRTRPTPDCGAVALLLTPQASGAWGTLTVEPTRDSAHALSQPSLEALRGAIPALRALPLLQAIANGAEAVVVLDHLAPMQLRVSWQPC